MNFFKNNHEHKNVNRIDVSKTLKMLVLVVVITFSSNVSANTNPVDKKDERVSVSKTVSNLLKKHDFDLDQDEKAMVDLFVNENDEIVVLSVDTDNRTVEKYIKNKLNYKKVSKDVIGNKRSFKVPVKFLKTS